MAPKPERPGARNHDDEENGSNAEPSKSPDPKRSSTVEPELNAFVRRMLQARHELTSEGWYLGNEECRIVEKTMWKRDGNGDVLVTRGSFDAQKAAMDRQAETDDEVLIPPCIPALLSIVVALATDAFFMNNPMANYDSSKSGFASDFHAVTVLNGFGIRPTPQMFSKDFQTSLLLIRRLVDSCAKFKEKSGFVRSTSSGIEPRLKFRHPLLRKRDDDDLNEDFLPGLTSANWPECTTDARNALAAEANQYYIKPLPVYDRNGQKMRPENYKDLKGALVQIKFGLTHFPIKVDTYCADIEEIRVLKEAVIGGVKRTATEAFEDRKARSSEVSVGDSRPFTQFPKTSLICLGIAYFSGFALGGVVQKPGLAVPAEYDANRVAVGQIFDRSYTAYQEYARGHDDLRPLNKSSSDSRNGWGASLVDALTTMKIMGRDDLFDDAVKQIADTDFSKSHTPDTVSVFETTIRYLGGMLSAYELNGKKDQVLLDQAKVLADKMAFAWVDGNDIPYGHIDFTTNSPTKDTSNIAEAGTLTLEWSTLTKYTKNATYQNLAERSARKILKAPAPLPGLPAQGINPAGGQPVGGYVTWGGGSDSYFEYLIKYPRLTNTNDQSWADAWATAVDSSIKTLLKTSSRGKYAYLADYDSNKQIQPIGSHLACFYGGNWLLGGKLMNNKTMVDIGLHLNDGCWNTYASTLTGIGPEAFAFTPDDDTSFANLPPADQAAFNAAHGFWLTTPLYYLRPEVMESNFYAWRLTGDLIYLERAAQVIQSFNKYLRTDIAYAGIMNVNQQNSQKIDIMESFWFAEVLKYLYLTFDDPSRYSLDNYVFNTEAHPFELPDPKPMYGTSPPTPTSDDHKPFTPTDGDVPAVSPAPGLPSDLSNLLGGL